MDSRSGEPESLGEVNVLWSGWGEPKRSSEKISLKMADLDSIVKSEGVEGLLEERGDGSGCEGIVSCVRGEYNGVEGVVDAGDIHSDGGKPTLERSTG